MTPTGAETRWSYDAAGRRTGMHRRAVSWPRRAGRRPATRRTAPSPPAGAR
ncbi:hypothetical protein ABT270_15125 [Streptomyces sp900105245]|uniref:hypothetical protein n=1 Tax=Streptomyces sp. 900105245 TaxID=3154379 RepID=UPI00332D2413